MSEGDFVGVWGLFVVLGFFCFVIRLYCLSSLSEKKEPSLPCAQLWMFFTLNTSNPSGTTFFGLS